MVKDVNKILENIEDDIIIFKIKGSGNVFSFLDFSFFCFMYNRIL